MSQQQPYPNSDPYKSQGRWSAYALVIGLVVLALMGGFALGRGGALGLIPGKGGEVSIAGPRPTGSPIEAVGSMELDPIEAVAQQAEPDTQLGFDPLRPNLDVGYQPSGPTTERGDKMPPEVRAWLEHLERIESERHRMTKAQLSTLLGQMMGMGAGNLADLTAEAMGEEVDPNKNYDPQKKEQLKSGTEKSRQGWKDLVAYFNSKQPPAECVPIKNAYEQCLGETSAMMLSILNELERSQGDPQGAINSLMAMMGTSEGKIDVAANKTDSLVGQICHKYDSYKWFKVSGDIGGGLGSLGLGGLGGLGGGMGGLSDLLGGGG